jgi:tRNA dimethylallyltransferase
VGGTGLYVRVLLHGVVEVPAKDASLRASLEALARDEGDLALHRRLEEVDPVSASRLPSSDRVRTIRALEISLLTGRSASEWRKEHGFLADRYEYRLWVLDPPRSQLYAAIDERVRSMFQQGLVEEVRSLVARGWREAPPMRSVGYAQALDCLEGRLPLDAAIADTARATRRYAKRQWTWFRRERGAQLLGPPYDVDALA